VVASDRAIDDSEDTTVIGDATTMPLLFKKVLLTMTSPCRLCLLYRLHPKVVDNRPI
jgi:hypothetical protein